MVTHSWAGEAGGRRDLASWGLRCPVKVAPGTMAVNHLNFIAVNTLALAAATG